VQCVARLRDECGLRLLHAPRPLPPPRPPIHCCHASVQGGGCTPFFDLRVNGDKAFDYRRAVGKRLRRYKRGEAWVDFDLTKFDVRLQGNIKIQVRGGDGEGRTIS